MGSMKDKEDLQMLIGNRIKTLREEKNVPQQDLAAKCNIEKSNLSRIEAGRTNPTIYTLYKIAKNLNVSLFDIVNFECKN